MELRTFKAEGGTKEVYEFKLDFEFEKKTREYTFAISAEKEQLRGNISSGLYFTRCPHNADHGMWFRFYLKVNVLVKLQTKEALILMLFISCKKMNCCFCSYSFFIVFSG